MLPDIRSQLREELAAQFQTWDLPAYRLDQLLEWLYARRANSWEEMTNLPKALRARLQEHYSLRPLELVRQHGSADTTRKFLWRLQDGAFIESVLIPANPALYGEPSDRHTLCVSTQVGCAYGCRFCASGLEGWKRNLRPEEIVGQILGVERLAGGERHVSGPDGSSPPRPLPSGSRLVNNLVIMGMGEPLANYDNLIQALRILNAPWGGGVGARKITVSTSGLVPQIRRLAEETLQVRLAISLHGATDETRNKLMPINRKYPLPELTRACEYYHERTGRMITLEYILIAGVNDHLRETKPLALLARRLHAKVNLIPYNRVGELSWERPDEATQDAFLAALQHLDVPVTLRREKGHDIDAACGQLRLRVQREHAQAEDAVGGRN